eukprot:1540441-Rhodomonas_salina.1
MKSFADRTISTKGNLVKSFADRTISAKGNFGEVLCGSYDLNKRKFADVSRHCPPRHVKNHPSSGMKATLHPNDLMPSRAR